MVGALDRWPDISRAGRQNQMVIGDRLARRGRDLTRRPIDLRHSYGVSPIDRILVEEALGFENQSLPIAILHIGFGKRWALIGQARLVAEENDLSLMPLLPQARRELHRGLSGADDDDLHPFRPFPTCV